MGTTTTTTTASTTTVTTTAPPSGACMTISGNVPNAACVFPFTFSGKQYTRCTTAGGFSSPWCSTQTDSRGNHVQGQWGNCDPDSCPGCSGGRPSGGSYGGGSSSVGRQEEDLEEDLVEDLV